MSDYADVVARLDGWQPIETAPRDGRAEILVFANDGNMFVAIYSPLNQGFVDTMMGNGLSPTHWMPLPEPPSP
jgi:hypothetical protein